MRNSSVYGLLAVYLIALAAAPATAAPYSETTGPPDAEGAVILIHGGGWTTTGEAVVQALRWRADPLDDRWATLSIDHRPGMAGFQDVLDFHDRLRAERGAAFPICAVGMSSGAHFALMLAVRRELACAVSNGGPTDLLGGGMALMAVVRQAFGYGEQTYVRFSPVHRAAELGDVPLLLAYETGDSLVTPEHAFRLAARTPHAHLHELPSDRNGDQFVHTTVALAVQEAYFAAERHFIAAAFERWATARPPH